MGKDRKNKLPKRIGGVKLPGKARKQANKAIAALNQPLVRSGLATAFGIAAAAMTRQAEKMREATASAPVAPAEVVAQGKAKSPPGNARDGAQMAELVTGLAVAALGRWMAKGAPQSVAAEQAASEPK